MESSVNSKKVFSKRLALGAALLIGAMMFTACGDEGASAKDDDEKGSSFPGVVTYGTLEDARDGQTYKTVTIGSQTWMAENLNYAYKGVKFREGSDYESDSISWCYKNSLDSCAKYGRLYTWAAAMDSAAQFLTAGKGCGFGKTCSFRGTVRGVCPEGWHLPNDTEWNTLWNAVGGTDVAGAKLKSTSGWYGDGDGTDSYGFAVLPVGYRFTDGDYSRTDLDAYFWSSSEFSNSYANDWNFNFDYEYVTPYGSNKNSGFSVRCLKDSK